MLNLISFKSNSTPLLNKQRLGYPSCLQGQQRKVEYLTLNASLSNIHCTVKTIKSYAINPSSKQCCHLKINEQGQKNIGTLSRFEARFPLEMDEVRQRWSFTAQTTRKARPDYLLLLTSLAIL